MRFTTIALLVSAALLCGCNRGPTHPPVYAAGGKVLMSDMPLAGAEVTFTPKGDEPGAKPARGTTNAEGVFELRTYFSAKEDAPGAMAGEYDVTMRKIAAVEGRVDPYKKKLPGNELPKRYADAKQSNQSATVDPKGTNRFEFRLVP